jgi:hypothetical protein
VEEVMTGWPHPNDDWETPGYCTHQRDPVGGEVWIFFEGEDSGASDARRYYELAVRHQISFRGIFNMLVATLRVLYDYDLEKELRELCEEGEHNISLMRKFALPAGQLVRIWLAGLEALHRQGEIVPELREKNEAFIAEQYEAMVAMLEKYQRKQEAN